MVRTRRRKKIILVSLAIAVILSVEGHEVIIHRLETTLEAILRF